MRATSAESRKISLFPTSKFQNSHHYSPSVTGLGKLYIYKYGGQHSLSLDMVTTRSQKRPLQTCNNRPRSVTSAAEDKAPKNINVAFDIHRDHVCHTQQSIPHKTTSQVLLTSQHFHHLTLAHYVRYRATPKTWKPSENIFSINSIPENIPKPSALPRYPERFPSRTSHRWD